MKYVFIPLASDSDRLYQIEHKEVRFDFVYDSNRTYSLYEINNYACLLRPDQNIKSNVFWESKKFIELFKQLKETFLAESEGLVIAIHWGGKDSQEEAQKLCDNRIKDFGKNMKNKCRLTHYSGNYDKDTIDKLKKNGSNINLMKEKITERIGWNEKKDKINVLYELKEEFLRRLFPLTLGQKLESEEIKGIKNVVESKNNEIGKKALEYLDKNGDKILKSIDERISIVLESAGGKETLNTEDYSEKLKYLREYLNALIDKQLKKANKKPIYER